jgi:hypothetical protein
MPCSNISNTAWYPARHDRRHGQHGPPSNLVAAAVVVVVVVVVA